MRYVNSASDSSTRSRRRREGRTHRRIPTATDSSVFDTGSIAPTSAADVPVPFTTVGTYNFHCTLHANETGSIVVTQ
jgi:plastocyanin